MQKLAKISRIFKNAAQTSKDKLIANIERLIQIWSQFAKIFKVWVILSYFYTNCWIFEKLKKWNTEFGKTTFYLILGA